MLSVLLFSRFPPGGPKFGSATRLARVLDYFAGQQIRVHFVVLTRKLHRGFSRGALPNNIASFQQIQLYGCCTPGPLTAPWRHLTRPQSLAKLWSWTGWNPLETDLTGALATLLEQTDASAVWVDHGDLTPLLAHLPPNRQLVKFVDTQDCMHQRDRSLQAAGLPAECGVSAADERELLDRADVIVAIQNAERETLQRLLPRKRVITVGHAAESAPQPCLEPDVCFVGSKYRVNETSLLTFLERAWPAIRARCPASRLEIAGGVGECPAVIAAARGDRRIVLRGVVRETADMYRGPGVVVCPLWTGSGLKIKLVEALAHGKATVATPIAAQGIEEGINQAFALASEPEDFVEPVVELLKRDSLREAWEARALAFARQKFAPHVVWSELANVLAELKLHEPLRRAA